MSSNQALRPTNSAQSEPKKLEKAKKSDKFGLIQTCDRGECARLLVVFTVAVIKEEANAMNYRKTVAQIRTKWQIPARKIRRKQGK